VLDTGESQTMCDTNSSEESPLVAAGSEYYSVRIFDWRSIDVRTMCTITKPV
jgi:hypothetical protein